MTEFIRLQAFGLNSLLTEQDDPALWEAALSLYWPAPDSPDSLVEALRFDVGRMLADGELPQGETNEQHFKMRGMVDIEEWCFERVSDAQLKVKTCQAVSAPVLVTFPGMDLSTMMSRIGQTPLPPLAQVVFMYLGITRPSREASQAVVYTGFTAPGVGEGNAFLWRRSETGEWVPTDQRVAWWIT